VTSPRDPRRLVVALGGRALPLTGRSTRPEAWRQAVERALPPLVDVVAAGFRLALVPGGEPSASAGPAAGRDRAAEGPLALDLRVAEAQGAAGYRLQQALGNLCRARDLDIPLGVVVTRVEVAADDPAFAHPTRAVGPTYSIAQARRLAREHGWTFVGSAATRRRAVPSPRPRRVLEADVIRRLVDAGVLAIATGGGVAVVDTPEGYQGVEAVLQPDATAAVVATAIAADRLVFLTGVDRVEVGHRTERAIGVERLCLGDAHALLRARAFPATSIGPKIEAAIGFVEAGGREAIITSPPALRAALDGRAGTHVVP
jgi:carbamate kinase